MNRLLIITFFCISFSGFSQTIFGKWKTVDTKDIEKSIVEIYKTNETVYGKIIEVLLDKDKNSKCSDCKGDDYNKPVLGMTIIKNMKKNGECYKNGTIVDPNNGKIYKLKLCLDEDNTDILIVRGYIGFFYETQYWKRVKE